MTRETVAYYLLPSFQATGTLPQEPYWPHGHRVASGLLSPLDWHSRPELYEKAQLTPSRELLPTREIQFARPLFPGLTVLAPSSKR